MSRIKRVYLHALLCGITAWLFACEPDPVPFYPDAGSASDAASDQDTTIQDGGLTDADTDTDSITPSDAAPPSGPCNEVEWSRIDTGFIGVCGAGRLELTPGVHANGEWRDPSVCAPDGERGLSCTFEGFGRLVVEQVATAFRARYTADQDQVFGGTRLAGTAYLPEADAWLSNGFQSWSQSGVIAIPQSITNNERHVALRAQGDIEVIRNGRENSWWHTFVRSKPALVAGATTALGFRSWIGLSGIAPNFTVQFSSGGSGEALELPSGREIVGE